MNQVFATSGGRRSVPVEQTLQKLKGFLRPEVVRHIEYFNPYEQPWCHVVVTINNSPDTAGFTKAGACAGKGGTRAEAIVSGLAESIERLSSFRREVDVHAVSAMRGLRRYRTLAPNAIDGFSDSQIGVQARSSEPSDWRPQLFEAACPIEWSRAWSWSEQEYVYVPTQSLTFTPTLRHQFCRAHSNGLSAGNEIRECLTQGFLELVERDALAIWWYNRVPRPRLELQGSQHPFVTAAQENFSKIGRSLSLFDLTHDLGIPVIAAVSYRPGPGPQKIIVTAGAHFDPSIAAARALTEQGQWLCNQDNYEKGRPVQMEPFFRALYETVRLEEHAFLQGSGETLPLRSRFLSFEEETSAIRTAVEKAGSELILYDLTRPEFDFPVLKVIVPGLAMHWPRFGNRRLYDVPVALGWLPKATREEDLNPLWM